MSPFWIGFGIGLSLGPLVIVLALGLYVRCWRKE